MSEPSVSVVITTYNRCELVGDAIESVLVQTYSDFELFVVDDASTDDTQAVVESHDDDRLTYVRKKTNRHLSAARNTGIERANGKHIAYLDDDDEWVETKLERQVERFEAAFEQVSLVYCWMDYYEGDEVIKEYHPTLRSDIYPTTLGWQPLRNGSTWLVRAEVFDAVRGFDEDIRRGVDSDFVRRACQADHVDLVPEVLAVYNVGYDARRITGEAEDSIRAAIEGQRTKFRKFGSAFEQYPTQEAIVRAKIGWRRTQLGEWRNGIAEFDQAIRLAPTCPTVYYYVGVTVFHVLKRLFSSKSS